MKKVITETKNLVEFVSEITFLTGCMGSYSMDDIIEFLPDDFKSDLQLVLNLDENFLGMSEEFDRKTFLAVGAICDVYGVEHDIVSFR